MRSLVTGWADKTTELLGSPTALRVGAIFWAILFIVSQLAIVFFFLEPKIDVGAGLLDSIKAIGSAGSLLAFGKLAVTAVALALIKIKILVLLLGAAAVVGVIFIPILVPDSLIEPIDEIILLGEIGFAVVVLGIALLEVLPFVLV